MRLCISLTPQSKEPDFSPVFAIECKEPSKQRFKVSLFKYALARRVWIDKIG